MSAEHIPPPKMLRVPAVMARTGLSRTTIYRRVRAGTFPAPADLGNGPIGWTDSAIDTWQRDLPSVSYTPGGATSSGSYRGSSRRPRSGLARKAQDSANVAACPSPPKDRKCLGPVFRRA